MLLEDQEVPFEKTAMLMDAVVLPPALEAVIV